MEKDLDFPKLIEDVFDEFEAANNLYEPETGKTFMAHADFAEIVGKKYNMPDNELDSLLMIIVDNQMKDKNRPYMVSRDTFKQGSNVAQSVQDYVNGNPVTIEKSFTDQQQTMFEGTYQRKLPDTPTNVVDEATNIYDVNEIENYANGNQRITPDQVTELEALTNTYKDQANNIVNKLPLEDTVKKKLRNKLSQMSVKWTTFSGAGELLDIYETGVLLFYGLVAAKPELEKIASNYMIDMYNTMAEPYGAKINREEYTPNWENINEQLTKAEKITPTDIIIKKTKELAKDTGETGMVTGFGYVPTTKDKLNKTLAYPKPVEADVVDPMYDRIKRTFSGKFV